MSPYSRNLFGEKLLPETKRIILRKIESRYRKEVVREDAPAWVNLRFSTPAQVFEIFLGLRQATKEHFVTLHLDGKNRITCYDPVSVGSLNQAIVHPREVFSNAVRSSAAAILLIHNHPSGDPKPSREDMEITRRLKEAGEILGIRVLDHIIIGDSYLSFVEQGLL